MSKFNITANDVLSWYLLIGDEKKDALAMVGYAKFILDDQISSIPRPWPLSLCARFFDVNTMKKFNDFPRDNEAYTDYLTHSALHNELNGVEFIEYFRENNLLGKISKELFSEIAKRRAFRYDIEFSDPNMKLQYEKELIIIDELAALHQEIATLRAENEELKLRPPELGGPLYEEARKRFDAMKSA